MYVTSAQINAAVEPSLNGAEKSAIVVIAISVILTFIGGFIPAKIASRKDPVEFLKNQN